MPLISRDARHEVRLRLNGEEVSGYAEPRMLLSDFIRHELGATGTHVGCEHGICGACTVRVQGRAVRSCLMLAVQAQGCEVTTIEGLLTEAGELSPLQQAFQDNFALQCGYCTPGILMSLDEFLEHNPDPDEATVREALSGNLCRCTGYEEIVKAALQAAAARRNGART